MSETTPESAPLEAAQPSQVTPPSLARDIVALMKPGILAMCLFTAGGAIALAASLPGRVESPFPWPRVLWGLLGTAASVGAANALNQWIERDGDRLMRRTRERPLPAGRMHPAFALAFGVALGVASLVLLALEVNAVSTALAAFAILSYVLVYTPLKRRSTQALAVGAVPGAIPPLLGWAIATGRIEAPGIALFLILFVWQLPHFIAISIYRRRDYEDAGIHVVPNIRGLEAAKNQSLAYSLALVSVSLLLVPLRVAGFTYFAAVGVLGAWFFVLSMQGFEPGADQRWARRFFFASLVYMPALTLALLIDRVLR